jgi:hypothetical protein
MPICSFIQPGVFDPEAIAVMSEVLEAACKEFGNAGQPDVMREVIAQRIIQAARLANAIQIACGKLRCANKTSP